MNIAQINQLQTPNGGWTKADLASLGVPWPPPHGWKKKLLTKPRPEKSMSKRKAYYLSYLKSEHWYQLRAQAFERDRHRCGICGSGRNLTGHHKRYPKDLTTCTVEDIETLCWFCHHATHQSKKNQRRAKARARRERRKRPTDLVALLMDYSAS